MAFIAASASPTTVFTGKGAILAIMASTKEAASQLVTLYDNTEATGTILLRFNVAPNQHPFYARLPERAPLRFSTGLSVNPSLCDVLLITAGG